MTLNSFRYTVPSELESDLRVEAEAWEKEKKVQCIWDRDASVWTGSDEAKWLGWLEIVEQELADLQKYRDLRADLDEAAFSGVLLMGMGGSSLCPEVLAITFGKRNFHILDSTVPSQIKAVEERLDLEKTLFIVASKSGSTLEPNCFKQYFFERLAERVGRENAGRQFIAITDPGSKMEQVAREDGFRHIIYGKPEIGGRFSALSAFGMTAAAAMDIDVEAFLTQTFTMVKACRQTGPALNPGALLGIILGVCHRHGRDKLTIFTSPEIYDVGAWLEQLIAESTGKNGVAIIPVDREPIPHSGDIKYGNDRVFAFLTVGSDQGYDEIARQIDAAGHPVVKLDLASVDTLGQEFFRWEFATAVAGSVMGINPFDQPDVESAKIEARKITEQYEQTGTLPGEQPFFSAGEFSLFAGPDYAEKLFKSVTERSIRSILNAHLDQIADGDYFALLAYLEMNSRTESELQGIRERVLASRRVATCLGFGPRFLHSTGQAYKGGPNSGVFLQITADDPVDMPVPGQNFSFEVVKAAQARGDFQVLVDRGRRALRVHLSDGTAGLRGLVELI